MGINASINSNYNIGAQGGPNFIRERSPSSLANQYAPVLDERELSGSRNQRASQEGMAIRQGLAQMGYLNPRMSYIKGLGQTDLGEWRFTPGERDPFLLAQEQRRAQSHEMLMGLLGRMQNGQNVGVPKLAGGPQIPLGGVYSQEAMGRTQNELRARAAAQAEGANRDAEARLAARGFGGSSPLLLALLNQNQVQGRMQGDQQANDFLRQAEVANADQTLRSYGLASQQAMQEQANQIDLYRAQTQANNAILSALVGMT